MSPPNGEEDSPEPNDGAPTFGQLIAFIDGSQAFLKLVLEQLEKSKLLDDEISRELASLAGTVELQANALARAIEDAERSLRQRTTQVEPNDNDRIYQSWAGGLIAHGLADSSDELRIKLFAYAAAHAEFMRHVDGALRTGKARIAVKAAKAPLRYLNVVLGSVVASIPVVGSIYKETKDEIHAAVDEGVDRSGWFQRTKDWVVRGGPKKTVEHPAETA